MGREKGREGEQERERRRERERERERKRERGRESLALRPSSFPPPSLHLPSSFPPPSCHHLSLYVLPPPFPPPPCLCLSLHSPCLSTLSPSRCLSEIHTMFARLLHVTSGHVPNSPCIQVGHGTSLSRSTRVPSGRSHVPVRQGQVEKQ